MGRKAVRRFAALLAALLTGMLVLSAAAAPPGWGQRRAPSWTIAATQNAKAPRPAQLQSVSCVPATAPAVCMSVGIAIGGESGGNTTYALEQNGGPWANTFSPNLGTAGNVLSSVSCVTPTLCTAVGYWVDNSAGVSSGTKQTLILVWNGSNWAQAASPNPGSGMDVLNGVSCLSATACTAVGSWAKVNGPPKTLVESWNGTAWSVVTSPSPGSKSNSLAGVSCLSASECTAVGSSVTGSGPSQTLVESWNGTAWSLRASPSPGTTSNSLAAISCVSASECTAVGSSVTGSGPSQTLVESWNGTAWSVVTSPDPGAASNSLAGVSCISATVCTAVGSSANVSDPAQTLVESWDGTEWSVVASPDPGSMSNALAGVSCVSATACTAAGSSVAGSDPTGTLVESWDGGTWSVVTTPNPQYGTNQFAAVACPPAAPCVAVGHWVAAVSITNTLAEAATASPWPITPSPNKVPVGNTLNSVACPAVNSCVAVGSYDAKPGVPHTLVESWNGASWSIVASPNFGTGKAVLTGVSCISPTSCVAVGYYLDVAGVEHSLIEQWNGSAWSTVRPQSPGAGSNVLTAVSCATSGATTMCAAVGHVFTSTGAELPLIESSSGGKWTVASTPGPGPGVNDLAGVSCPATNFCAAVGSYLTSGYVRQTLVEAWSGGAWSALPSPNQGTGSNAFLAVSCTSSTACMAVGTVAATTFDQMTLAQSWNGTGWSVTPSPNGRYKENVLTGVSCTGAAPCVAVGHSFTIGNTADVTLAEVYQ